MEALRHGARPPAVSIPTFFTFLLINHYSDCRSFGHPNKVVTFSGKDINGFTILSETQISVGLMMLEITFKLNFKSIPWPARPLNNVAVTGGAKMDRGIQKKRLEEG